MRPKVEFGQIRNPNRMRYFLLMVLAIVFGGLPGFAENAVRLPVDADNCAIFKALSGLPDGYCNTAGPSGPTRGLVLRVNETSDLDTGSGKTSPIRRVFTPSDQKTGKQPINRAAAVRTDGNSYFIQFAFDSSTLLDIYKEHLDRLVVVLNTEALAGSCLKVTGHTDTVGTDDYNLKLSVRRAQSVVKYIRQTNAVSSDRITIEGAGEKRPLPGIHGEHALNRRVEFSTKTRPGGC